jgi:hypothetical protein
MLTDRSGLRNAGLYEPARITTKARSGCGELDSFPTVATTLCRVLRTILP